MCLFGVFCSSLHGRKSASHIKSFRSAFIEILVCHVHSRQMSRFKSTVTRSHFPKPTPGGRVRQRQLRPVRQPGPPGDTPGGDDAACGPQRCPREVTVRCGTFRADRMNVNILCKSSISLFHPGQQSDCGMLGNWGEKMKIKSKFT